MIIVWLIVILCICIVPIVVWASSRSLHKRFLKLGTLKGKTFEEIRRVVGMPNSISTNEEGLTVKQWMQQHYHIVLIFDKNDICLGVTHESAF
ncbi:hypothetical protein CE91St36_23010 [Christensenellaceae bacterium]|uniref:hypothetical protein n=1 Tax=Christensenella TaxID=990721 RepID=UPI00073FF8FC|nr:MULTISPECIES: hypothetical protein [Christensenella]KUJ29254.1 hypothetical protein AR437_10005 [Christensenella hongkongensis]BDF59484.1 hypothetical protein CE91St36_23010 [Christensenellaceae bacterium]BDF62149.1 hypothetical protein CE91St37_22990 [Christensenellaceae bacterium]